jgi:hypothetical protein
MHINAEKEESKAHKFISWMKNAILFQVLACPHQLMFSSSPSTELLSPIHACALLSI